MRVDLLGSASGIDFAEIYERAVSTEFDDVPTRVISPEDLITKKHASGGDQDLKDCKVLERVLAKKRKPR